MERWGSKKWAPSQADKTAAAELHTQIVSRVATQPLGYTDGDETAALESIFSLFGKARDISDRNFGANHYERLVWFVFNTHVRPFTAYWHPRSKAGVLNALDATDEFRAELTALQAVLTRFDALLLEIRDGMRPPRDRERTPDRKIFEEIAVRMPWGIGEVRGNIAAADARLINEAERTAIRARRETYGLDAECEHASGFALSGGGIRSATFSLGVLVALGKRNLLPQFDYLSTVSGGGYLGAFITTFLSTPKEARGHENIGLKSSDLPFRSEGGEAEALRYIRHRSKYLHTSLWERLKIASAQVYGMAVNLTALMLFPVGFALIEIIVRPWQEANIPPADLLRGALWIFVAAALTLPLIVRIYTPFKRYVDSCLGIAAAFAIAVASWTILGAAHKLLSTPNGAGLTGAASQYLLGLVAALPLMASFIFIALGNRIGHLKSALGMLTALMAPLFLVGVNLGTYRWLTVAHKFDILGIKIPIVVALVLVLGLSGAGAFLLLDVNFTSPFRHYRRKLAETYLVRPASIPRHGRPFETAVSVKLSETLLGTRGPYPLFNCALNVPGSRDPAMQGRLTDFFLFSPSFCGSPLTGYQATGSWETADPDLDIATAMAVSGAAAAPLMGINTRRDLRFWMALLNIRLGYWVRKPTLTSRRRTPGLYYLLSEMFGRIDENAAFLNVTDGGHIENLGIYELIRRRCKYIVAVDGEYDASMTFQGLTNLQRLVAIDLGVSIDIDLDDLRLSRDGLSRSHFKFCRIRYPSDGEQPAGNGYMLYLKLSLTGNEGEFIKRYKLDEPSFPHHSTADQFFTETQFEAYRALGEHVGNKLFLEAIVGKLEISEGINIEKWFTSLADALLRPL